MLLRRRPLLRLPFLHQGQVLAEGPMSVVTPEHIRAVYGIDASVERIQGTPVVVPRL